MSLQRHCIQLLKKLCSMLNKSTAWHASWPCLTAVGAGATSVSHWQVCGQISSDRSGPIALCRDGDCGQKQAATGHKHPFHPCEAFQHPCLYPRHGILNLSCAKHLHRPIV